jgi:hypothetical protein
MEDALEILSRDPSEGSIEELKYLLSQAQGYVAKWRPSPKPTPGILYIQPNWAESTDRQMSEALALLADVRTESLQEESRDGTRSPKDAASTTHVRVFVSHSSKDREAARALADLLRMALGLRNDEIRCTSVEGYKLPVGVASDTQLRQEVFECHVFLALLSKDSLASTYVMFELGARWASEKKLMPILIGGLGHGALRKPLDGINACTSAEADEIHDLLRETADQLGLTLLSTSAYLGALDKFQQVAKEGSGRNSGPIAADTGIRLEQFTDNQLRILWEMARLLAQGVEEVSVDNLLMRTSLDRLRLRTALSGISPKFLGLLISPGENKYFLTDEGMDVAERIFSLDERDFEKARNQWRAGVR